MKSTAVAGVMQARAAGPYSDLKDVVVRLVGDGLATKSDIEALIRSGALDNLGNRAKMLVALPKLVEDVKRYGAKAEALDVPVPEVSLSERLAMERLLLGVYVSGHPLADCEDKLRQSVDALAFDLGDRRDGDQVTVGGVIHSVVLRKTKRDEQMAQVTLEDMTGHITLTLFPKVYARFAHMLKKADVLLVKGRVSVRERNEEEETQAEVMVEDIHLLEEREIEHTPTIHATIPTPAEGDILNWIFGSKEAGPVKVYYHLPEGDKVTVHEGASAHLTPQIIKDAIHRSRRWGGFVWVQ
jgi:DNA polymerase III alpha subunit